MALPSCGGDYPQKNLLEAIKIAFTLFVMRPPYPGIFSVGADTDGYILLYAEAGGRPTSREIAEIESCTIHGHKIHVLFRDYPKKNET